MTVIKFLNNPVSSHLEPKLPAGKAGRLRKGEFVDFSKLFIKKFAG
jgi:hypothetical protein